VAWAEAAIRISCWRSGLPAGKIFEVWEEDVSSIPVPTQHEPGPGFDGHLEARIALKRKGEDIGKSRVQRLMREAEIQGAKRRGKPWRTTKADPEAGQRPDLVERDFSATTPNRLWIGDLAPASSSMRCG